MGEALDEFRIKPDVNMRAAVSAIEDRMLEMKALGELLEVETPLQHHFAPGVYMRTMFIPAGTVIVGKIHRHAHCNVLSQGVARVTTEEGTELLRGPLPMVSKAGTKRTVVAITDVVWTTFHLTNETDLEKIEQEVIAPSFEALEAESRMEICQ